MARVFLDGSITKVDLATGVAYQSDYLDTGEARLGQPLIDEDLPASFTSAVDDPQTTSPLVRRRDDKFIYERRFGQRSDGTHGFGWAIVGPIGTSAPPPGPASPLDPDVGSMDTPTDVTLTDPTQDFGAAFQVNIADGGGATLLSAPISTWPTPASLTATVPAGSTGTGVTADTPYAVQVIAGPKGGGVQIQYDGAFSFAGGGPTPLSITSVAANSANAYGLNTITITGTGFTNAGIGRVRLKEHGGSYVAGAVGDGTSPYGRTVVDSHTITTVVQSAEYDGTFDMVMDVGLLDPSAGNQALATPLVELASAYTFPSA